MIRAFTEAASFGREVEVKNLLMADPMLVTAKTKDGWSPLLLAAYHGHPGIVKILLEKGASANEQDPDFRRTALHWAAQKDYAMLILTLASHGAHPNVKDSDNWTPLMRAAWSGSATSVMALTVCGADPRHSDEEGNTAESLAASSSIRMLLKMSRAACWTWRRPSRKMRYRGGKHRSPSGSTASVASTFMDSDEEEEEVLARLMETEVIEEQGLRSYQNSRRHISLV